MSKDVRGELLQGLLDVCLKSSDSGFVSRSTRSDAADAINEIVHNIKTDFEYRNKNGVFPGVKEMPRNINVKWQEPVSESSRIEAIKYVREICPCDLVEARDFVMNEEWMIMAKDVFEKLCKRFGRRNFIIEDSE